MIIEKGDFEGSPLDKFITRLVDVDYALRIWWVDNDPDSYKMFKERYSLSELKAELCKQYPFHCVRYSAS
jgi:hypothetical protein